MRSKRLWTVVAALLVVARLPGLPRARSDATLRARSAPARRAFAFRSSLISGPLRATGAARRRLLALPNASHHS
jgi:hypothetical protein